MAVGDFLTALWGLLCVAQSLNTVSAQYCEYNNNNVASKADFMYCKNLIAEGDLAEELRFSRRFNIKGLAISNSSFRFFPHNSFLGTKFKTIHIQNSHILDLSDTAIAFEGLEDHLQVLSAVYTTFVSSWNWNRLRNLRTLKSIEVIYSDLNYASNAFENASRDSLESLTLSLNGMTHIHETAFAKLRKLKHLDISHNAIKELKRSMFPNPAKLNSLYLRYNRLESLPADLFENMPNLVLLELSGNPLQTLSETTFSKIWTQLVKFEFYDSPLSCDCRLHWLSEVKRHPRLIYAYCSRPHELQGMSVTTLKHKDLWC